MSRYTFPAISTLMGLLPTRAGEGSDYTEEEQATDAAKKQAEEEFVSPYRTQSLPAAQDYVREDILTDPMVPAQGSLEETAMLRANMEADKTGSIRAPRDTDVIPYDPKTDPRTDQRARELIKATMRGQTPGLVSAQQASLIAGSMEQARRGEGETAMRRAGSYASVPTQFVGEELGLGKAIDLGVAGVKSLRKPIDKAAMAREDDLIKRGYTDRGTTVDRETRVTPRGVAQRVEGSMAADAVMLREQLDTALTRNQQVREEYLKRYDNGEVTAEAIASILRQLDAEAKMLKQQKGRIKDLDYRVAPVRGADIIQEKLHQNKRTGKLSSGDTDVGLDYVRDNPNLFDGTALSVKKQPSDMPNTTGVFYPESNAVEIYHDALRRADATDTVPHELLHVTERMLPGDVRQWIRGTWAQSTKSAARDVSPVDQPELHGALISAADDGGEALRWVLRNGLYKRGSDPAGRHKFLYSLTDPSEFWAVNGETLLQSRHAAQSGITARMSSWIDETVSTLKGSLNLDDRAPIIRGLNKLKKSDGTYQTPLSLSQGPEVLEEAVQVADLANLPSAGRLMGESRNVAPTPPMSLTERAAAIATRRGGAAEFKDRVLDVQPYEQTYDEYAQQYAELAQRDGRMYTSSPDQHEKMLRQQHSMAVDKAIEEGRPVPERVLAEYEDLLEPRRPVDEAFGTRSQRELVEEATSPALTAIRDTEQAEALVRGPKNNRVVVAKDGSVRAIADHFEQKHLRESKRMFNPYDNPKDFDTIKARMIEELEFQMSGAKSGKEWYDESVRHAFAMAAKQFEEMEYSEPHRVILSAIAAIQSPGQNAKRNWQIAMEAYEAYKQTGTISGFQRLQPPVPGGKRYGQGNLRGLRWLDYLLATKGEKETAKWMLSPHTVRSLNGEKQAYAKWARKKYGNLTPEEIQDIAATHGYIPADGKKFNADEIKAMIYADNTAVKDVGNLDDLVLGADAFGPKVGPFMKNINGLYDVTGDIWAIRTVRRHMGDSMLIDMEATAKALGVDPKGFRPEAYAKNSRAYKRYLKNRVVKLHPRKKTEMTVEAPTSDRERQMLKRLFNEVGEATGLKGYQAQAVLWYFEQKLYRSVGGKQISYSFPEGGAKYLADRGVDFSDIPYEGLVHNVADDVLTEPKALPDVKQVARDVLSED